MSPLVFIRHEQRGAEKFVLSGVGKRSARNARTRFEKFRAVYWKKMASDEPNLHAVLLEPDALDVIP